MRLVRLHDGSRIQVRPVRPAAAPSLAAAWLHASPDSRRRRMHGTAGPLTGRDLAQLTGVDHLDHEAIVAVDPDQHEIIGVARYIRDSTTSAWSPRAR